MFSQIFATFTSRSVMVTCQHQNHVKGDGSYLMLVSNNNMHIDVKPYFCLLYRSILKYRGMRCFPLGVLPNSFVRFSISRNVNKYGVSALAVSESLQK